MQEYQKRAFDIAGKIDPHHTSPNPRVGCVIMKDGKIVAEGTHEHFGGSHAEINAIHNAKNTELNDCEFYITLEPCDHFEGKKTPSCTDVCIEKRPKKIYIGSLDPQFLGKNVEKIKAAGIDVEVLHDGLHKKLNPFFKKHILTKKPYITLKVAQSLDGKITNTAHASAHPEVQYLTNEKSLQRVHEMRASYSAILTTTQTILADNPQMNVRFNASSKQATTSNPKLIILGQTHLPKSLNIFQQKNREIFQFADFNAFWESNLAAKVDSVMTECGSTLNTYLLANNFVDEIQLFIAPKIIGGDNIPSFASEINLEKFQLKNTENLDGDVLMVFKK